MAALRAVDAVSKGMAVEILLGFEGEYLIGSLPVLGWGMGFEA